MAVGCRPTVQRRALAATSDVHVYQIIIVATFVCRRLFAIAELNFLFQPC